MAAPIKADAIYYNTPSDFELEFNICGCCSMRLLSSKPQTKKDFLRALSIAVSRSQIILAIGSLSGDENIIDDLCTAIGYEQSERELTAFGIDERMVLPERSIPLVTVDGRFGGCVIECGPQSIIVLTDDKELRRVVMKELVHEYVRDFERGCKRAEAAERANKIAESTTSSDLFPQEEIKSNIGDPYVIKQKPDRPTDFSELENEFAVADEVKKKSIVGRLFTVLFILLFLAAGIFAYIRFAEPLVIKSIYKEYSLMHGQSHALLGSNMLDSMGELYAENPDTVGFLSVDGTDIEYPVVTDRNKQANYYQKHLYNGWYSYIYGTPYTVNDITESSYHRNILIFGKDTHPDVMFGRLSEIATLSGYHTSHIIRFDTLYHSAAYKIFAAFSYNGTLPLNLLQTEFENDGAFAEYVELLREQSDINTTVEVLPSDEIVTLVSYGRDSQVLVAARRIREGENELVNTQKATLFGSAPPEIEQSERVSDTVSVLPSENTAFADYAKEYEQSAPLDAETAQQNAAAFAKTVSVDETSSEESAAEQTAEEKYGSQIISVTDAATGQKVSGSTMDILCRVVEAEMGSGSESEAIKAQAIASYGWLLTNGAASGGAPTVALKTPQLKVTEAVRDVIGLKPYAGDYVAQTMYFPCSAGFSADCEKVFGSEIGYLTAAESSADKNSEDFISRRSYSADDIRKWVLESTGIDLSSVDDKSRWFNVAYDKNGAYVSHIWFGNQSGFYSGRFVREQLLSKARVGEEGLLLSTAFSISYQGESDTFLFEVRGRGHGVGMSQYGANRMAKSGKTYNEILEHYFDGITVSY